MSAGILRLPQTEAGKALLRLCVKVSHHGWDFPDGTNAADHEWDALAIEVEHTNAAYDRWLVEQERV